MKKSLLLLSLTALLFLVACKKDQPKDKDITQFHFDNKNQGIPTLLQAIDLTNFQQDYFSRALLQDSTYLTDQNSEGQKMVGVLIPIEKFKTDDYLTEIVAMGYQVPSLNEFLSFLEQKRNLFDEIENFNCDKVAVSFCGNTNIDAVKETMHNNYAGKEFSNIITFNECEKDFLVSKNGGYSRKLYLRETQDIKIRKDLIKNDNFIFAVMKTVQNNNF